jgi:hypothetical protein
MGGELMINYKKITGYTLIILFIIFSIIYFYPRKINREYNAIMYRLGDSIYSENIKVNINGYFSRGLLRGDNFVGFIAIGDKKLSKINMRFDNFNRGLIFCFDDNTGDYSTYGDMYSNKMMKKFTICILEEDKQRKGGKTWSGIDGLMISAPSSNRDEALDISNKLMKDVLSNTVLK